MVCYICFNSGVRYSCRSHIYPCTKTIINHLPLTHLMKFSLQQHYLSITLQALEKIWALHGSFSISFDHIVKAAPSLPDATWKMIRCPGTCLPGVIVAGTYYARRSDKWEREFWYYARGKQPLTLELIGEPYKRIVLGIEHSREWAEKVNSNIRDITSRF